MREFRHHVLSQGFRRRLIFVLDLLPRHRLNEDAFAIHINQNGVCDLHYGSDCSVHKTWTIDSAGVIAQEHDAGSGLQHQLLVGWIGARGPKVALDCCLSDLSLPRQSVQGKAVDLGHRGICGGQCDELRILWGAHSMFIEHASHIRFHPALP